jgi:lipopolysaccharide/colanic/teichoic acid biosynthesis glycosyltransferase
MKMLEQMRNSTEAGIEIMTAEAERLEPIADRSHYMDIGDTRPLLASNDVSAADAALIQIEPQVGVRPENAERPKQILPSASRMVDIIAATALLIVLLPVLAFITIFLLLFERGPVFFAHRRVGLGGKIFDCLKFRTMCVDADQRLVRLLANDDALLSEWVNTQKLVCDPRVTRFGRILRNTSLDELPQLINVLRGEMSLVGPRPIVEDEMRRYGRYAALYTSVRPGLTGLWQVTRNARTSYRRRVATDVLYVQNRTLAFDFKILLATVPAVLVGNR